MSEPLLNHFQPTLDRATRNLKRYKELKANHILLDRFEEFERSLHGSALDKGHAIMNDIRAKLAHIDTETYYRTPDQCLLQNVLISGLCRFAYKNAVEDHENEILRYNNFQSLKQQVFLSMPRRYGKSEMAYQLAAVLLLTCPGIKIVVISPSSRSAGDDAGFMDGVKRILRDSFGITKFWKENSEVLKYKINDHDIRTLCSYPGGAADK
jgi:hypothetical protein